ncbi:MAG TPA: SDR family oxidoreductase [Phycisphaerae bacterium]|nr:SDR family oxidoreductase [Phycisphaerae bacterium]
MTRNPFLDRHVLITGASSGIGAELARRFARDGARLALVARREDRLQALANEIADAGQSEPTGGWHGSAKGGPVANHAAPTVIAADLFDEDAPQRVLDQTRAALGPIDVLVNNAGLGYAGPFAEQTPEQTKQMLRLNIDVLVRMTELVLPEMLDRRSGWIMNVASTAAYQPMPYMATYAATKAFVLSWSEALWAEVRRRGVVVTAVCPGTTRTEFFDHHTWSAARDLAMRSAMSAERVADIAVKALARGRPSIACGSSNLVLAMLSRTMPRSWTARIIARVLKPLA